MIIHSESQTVIDLRNFRVEINYSIRSDNNNRVLLFLNFFYVYKQQLEILLISHSVAKRENEK